MKTSTGKPSVIKKINMSQILDIIRKKGPISRSEIAELTNLTPATITNITSELIDAKLIVEGESGESSGGRKPVMLRIRCDYYRVIGVYIGSRKLKIMASDLMANSKYNKQIVYEKEQVTYEEISKMLDCPIITGKTPNTERDKIYDDFRNGKIRVLVVSKVANFAIDLPDASLAIQVSGTFGSRQEEAQRLGRILRPKERTSRFFTLITRNTVEEEFGSNRQKFLAEQGYSYKIVRSSEEI